MTTAAAFSPDVPGRQQPELYCADPDHRGHFNGPVLRRAMVMRRLTIDDVVSMTRKDGLGARPLHRTTVIHARAGKAISDRTAARILAVLSKVEPLEVVG